MIAAMAAKMPPKINVERINESITTESHTTADTNSKSTAIPAVTTNSSSDAMKLPPEDPCVAMCDTTYELLVGTIAVAVFVAFATQTLELLFHLIHFVIDEILDAATHLRTGMGCEKNGNRRTDQCTAEKRRNDNTCVSHNSNMFLKSVMKGAKSAPEFVSLISSKILCLDKNANKFAFCARLSVSLAL